MAFTHVADTVADAVTTVVRTAVVCAMVIMAPAASIAGEQTYAGRPVADVLQELQAAGLRVLFSSDLVPATLRVKSEPTSRDPRQIAVHILEPHGLTLKDGPRGTLLVVARPVEAPRAQQRPRARRERPAVPDAASPGEVEPARGPEDVRIEERVEVIERLVEPGMGTTTYTMPPSTIRETAGGFENPFQTFQVLPGVAAINDDSGKLAVRGAGPEHNIVVFDGVQVHNPYRFSELTSSFLNLQTAASVALDASGLDARYGGRLSSVTVIETRDGSRDRRLAASGSLGLANGDVLLEGRLPKSESGAWWVSARGTYYRPVAGLFRSGTLPNFGDVQFKVTVRPTPRTRLAVFGMTGTESTHGNPNTPADDFNGAEFTGTNRLGLMNLSWTPSARLVSTTTVSMYAHEARDVDDIGPGIAMHLFERARRVEDVAVRQHMMYAISPRHVMSAGVDLHRIHSSWRMTGTKPPEIFWRGLGPSTWGEGVEYPPSGVVDSRLSRTQAGMWLQDRIPVGSRLSVEPGVRLDWNSYTGESAWQPRLRVAARVGGAAVWAGYAVQAQTPSHESLQGFDYFQLPDTGTALRNERSRQIVAGVERGLGAGFDLRVEAYRRRFDRLLVQRLETDAERAARLSSFAIPPDMPGDDALLEYRPTFDPESVGRGTATGVEVLLQRSGTRVSGWAGYTYGRTRRSAYGYTFPFDFDRPHTMSVVANVRLSSRIRLSATALRASGFPITPLHEEVLFAADGQPVAQPRRTQDGSLWVAPSPALRRLSLRNAARLSGYSRVDVRVTYATLGRWELYGEVINALGNRNHLQTMPVPSIGGSSAGGMSTANDVYETFERFPTFGVRVRF